MTLKVLFVDDDALILNALKRSLSREGFEIHTTLEPNDAVKLIVEHGIDVIVSDYMMPQLTGIELLSLVRALQPRVTRIMLTGQADRAATIRAINEGAVSRYIEKPWDDASLKRILHEIERERQVVASTQEGSAPPRLRSVLKDKSGAIIIPEK